MRTSFQDLRQGETHKLYNPVSQKSFQVKSDGRLESEVRDQFRSTRGSVSGIQDRDLRAFVRTLHSTDYENPHRYIDDYEYEEYQLDNIASDTLGSGWNASGAIREDRREAELELHGDNGNDQTIFIDGESITITSAFTDEDGNRIEHEVKSGYIINGKRLVTGEITESASISSPSSSEYD